MVLYFWHDVWLGAIPLSTQFPVNFGLVTYCDAKISDDLLRGEVDCLGSVIFKRSLYQNFLVAIYEVGVNFGGTMRERMEVEQCWRFHG